MATTTYFEEEITDQGGKVSMHVEVARCSYWFGCPIPGGIGVDSIMLNVDGKAVIMDHATATRFVEAVMRVGQYHRLIPEG